MAYYPTTILAVSVMALLVGCATASPDRGDAKVTTIRVKSLNSISIPVSNLEKGKVFYTEVLGFEAGQAGMGGVLLHYGEMTLFLVQMDNIEKSKSRVIPCFDAQEGIKKAYESLKAANVTIVKPYQEYGPEFAEFQIADPDGNPIAFAGHP